MRIQKIAAAIVLSGAALFGSAQVSTAGPEVNDTSAAAAKKAASELMAGLKAELSAALKAGGPVAAIDICSSRAQALTAEIPARIGRPDIRVKRTSLKYRNPANRPTPDEEALLRQFAEQLRNGKSIQPILKETTEGLCYYQPLLAEPLCLNCHGTPRNMDPAVLKLVRQRYPGDRAVGFATGDLRGMVCVTVPGKP